MWIFVKDFESSFQLCHTIVCTFSTQHVYLNVVSDSDTQHLELHKCTQSCTERPCSLFTQGLLDRPHYFIICSSISLSNHLVEYSRNVLLEKVNTNLFELFFIFYQTVLADVCVYPWKITKEISQLFRLLFSQFLRFFFWKKAVLFYFS